MADPRATTSIRWPVLYASACLLANAALLPHFRDDLNPDGISYLSIAQKYLAGDVRDAVNAYWGPLLSWLLAPWLAAGCAPLTAARLAAGSICVVTAILVWRLAGRFQLPPWLRAALAVALLPTLLDVVCREITPDMLMVAVVLAYLEQMLRRDFGRRIRRGAVCGLLGGLAYLTKAFGFYFFLAHFVTTCGLLTWSLRDPRERRRMVRTAAAGLATFLLVAGAWVGALGWKYDRFLIDSTGAYNRALMAPGSTGHPMHRVGFLAPPNPTAVSAWEDPTYLPLPVVAPPAPGEARPPAWRPVAHRLKRLLDLAIGYCPLTPLILVTGIALSVAGFGRRQRAGPPRAPLWIPLLAVLIYGGGYALVDVAWRYVFIVAILLPLLGGELLEVEGRRWRDRLAVPSSVGRLAARVAGVGALALLLVPLATKPGKQLWQYYHYDNGVAPREIAAQLRGVVPPGARIASNQAWHLTLDLVFRLDGQYYGEQADLPLASVLPALRRLGVTHYFVWRETAAEAAAMGGEVVRARGLIPDLVIYDLRSRPRPDS
jgi:hypothetical protein